MSALFEESDLQLAEQAIASDLKLLEGLIKSDPNNEKFLLLACQGFASYALGFVEDQDPDRAKSLYLRGRDYGFKILHKNPLFQPALSGELDRLATALKKFDKSDVPALFWTANNWANWINLNLTDTDALADLPRVQLMMQRVIELDEGYFFGGAHLFFATIYASRPKLLGGDADKAQHHFSRCFEFAQEKFLLPYVYYARYYAPRTFDTELFTNTLQKVLATPDDILPEQRLPNAIAKRKASDLLQKIDELF
ncbi:MAG: TRAP transporter TatT component family protein [candidate division KSB1 bacterium]|nr:TRAP transporter TatT component family protein [candidate division KSB1 bacterium]